MDRTGTAPRRTRRLAPDAAGLGQAVELLRGGGLVAVPTETVYGLGADAANGKAVAAIYQAKGRPRFNPLIVHVADIAAARQLARFDRTADRLAEAFWPGPLTLVLPVRAGAPLSELVTAGLSTVALRVPAHQVARDLLRAFGGGIAAPSANPSGRISPTTAEHVLAGLDGRIDAVIDGGACPVGLESTIVAPARGGARLLRPGGLPAEALEQALGTPLGRAGAGIEAPGQMASHYAPAARVVLGQSGPRPGRLWLGFGPGCEQADLNLSPAGDLQEAAANLFGHLHTLDALAQERGMGEIGVAPIPDRGLGRAINDRLRRAAA